jgi:transcriptional antiterminator RfaH
MVGSSTDKSWYLLYSKARAEQKALDNLQRQGYTAYLPLIEQKKRVGARLKNVIAPIFPRYLFVQLQAGLDDFRPIRSTIGIANMVRFSGRASIVPDSLIEQLQRYEQGADVIEPKFIEGDAVKIAAGPFAQYEAIFQSQCADERAIILLKLAERTTQLKINLADIDKIA